MLKGIVRAITLALQKDPPTPTPTLTISGDEARAHVRANADTTRAAIEALEGGQKAVEPRWGGRNDR